MSSTEAGSEDLARRFVKFAVEAGVLRFGEFRTNAQRAAKACLRLLQPPEASQRVAQVEVGHGIVRHDLRRPRQRLQSVFALFAKSNAQQLPEESGLRGCGEQLSRAGFQLRMASGVQQRDESTQFDSPHVLRRMLFARRPRS